MDTSVVNGGHEIGARVTFPLLLFAQLLTLYLGAF